MVRFVYDALAHEFTVVRFAHWEFLFGISALFGLYVMHALSRVHEGPEIAEREVIQEFALEALQSVNNLSTLGGTPGAIFPFFDRVLDRFGLRNTGLRKSKR